MMMTKTEAKKEHQDELSQIPITEEYVDDDTRVGSVYDVGEDLEDRRAIRELDRLNRRDRVRQATLAEMGN